jgi:glycosyltransferase involved in cell wall biosynthesis
VNYVLTAYPLSSVFRKHLEEVLASECVYLSLADLRKQRARQAVRRLRSMGGARLVLALEDESSRCILPVLKAVAAASNASVVEVRYPDLHSECIGRGRLVAGLAALVAASVAARGDAFRCDRDLAQLVGAPRAAVVEGNGKALYLNANLWFGVKAGGSIGHVAGVVNALNEGGCPIVYAAAGGRTMIRSDIESVALTPAATFGLPFELNYYRFHRRVVRQLVASRKPRFIYQRMSLGNYAGVKLSRHWKIPLIAEYNGSEVWVAQHWGRPLRYHALGSRAEEVCLRHAHIIVTISEVLRDELIGRGVSPESIVCYPNCIDPTVFDPTRFSEADSIALRAELGLPSNALLATFVGTFGQWHGAEVLARAIKCLIDQHRSWLTQTKLHFVLVGDGVKMPVVREILAGQASGEFVTLTGLVAQAEAPAYLSASDVLLSPHVANADGSRFFGSPTKLFEYMAMGKAIIASDLDQIGTVLQDSLRSGGLPSAEPTTHETALGILIPPGDVTALVDAIKFAVDRSEWRTVLGKNARTEALAKYTWMHHVDAILDVIPSVVQRPSVRQLNRQSSRQDNQLDVCS